MSAQPLLTASEVSAQCRIPMSTVYAYSRAGKFPPPIRLSPRRSVWRQSDVTAWLNARIAESSGSVAA